MRGEAGRRSLRVFSIARKRAVAYYWAYPRQRAPPSGAVQRTRIVPRGGYPQTVIASQIGRPAKCGSAGCGGAHDARQAPRGQKPSWNHRVEYRRGATYDCRVETGQPSGSPVETSNLTDWLAITIVIASQSAPRRPVPQHLYSAASTCNSECNRLWPASAGTMDGASGSRRSRKLLGAASRRPGPSRFTWAVPERACGRPRIGPQLTERTLAPPPSTRPGDPGCPHFARSASRHGPAACRRPPAAARRTDSITAVRGRKKMLPQGESMPVTHAPAHRPPLCGPFVRCPVQTRFAGHRPRIRAGAASRPAVDVSCHADRMTGLLADARYTRQRRARTVPSAPSVQCARHAAGRTTRGPTSSCAEGARANARRVWTASPPCRSFAFRRRRNCR